MPENNLNVALLDIQTHLSVPKGRVGETANGTFEYRNLDDILIALKPFQTKHGLVVRFDDSIVEISGTLFVKSVIIVTNAAGEQQTATGFAALYSSKGLSPAQVSGACSTYARKYAANALFCLDDSTIGPSPDPDSHSAPEKTEHQPEQKANGSTNNGGTGQEVLTKDNPKWPTVVEMAAEFKSIPELRKQLSRVFSFTEETFQTLRAEAGLA